MTKAVKYRAVKYTYDISGKDGKDQDWKTTGEVFIYANETVPAAINKALIDSFIQLTRGQAIYGRPGERCSGPYKTIRVLVERVT